MREEGIVKIILRQRTLRRGQATSAFTSLCGGIDYLSKEDFLRAHPMREAMKKIYDEELESDILDTSALYTAYDIATKTCEDNEFFIVAYKVDDRFAVHLTGDIYLYHLLSKGTEVCDSLVPWYYADSKLQFGHTWWETDSEIIESIKTLSILDFLEKYKGY